MEIVMKYALLDTDFLSKSHLARNSAGSTLADLVLGFADYEFYCHEMIKKELDRREIYPDPTPWLEEQINAGRIKLYTDKDIIGELGKVYGAAATRVYSSLLKFSCDTFDAGFYGEHYGPLESITNIEDADCFITALNECDEKIPHRMGIGEKKSFVLAQMLEILHGDRVYVFCSDDFKARQSIAGLPKPINCLSVLGIFYKLMKMGHDQTEMQDYYDHLSAFLKNQTDYKVWSASGYQRVKVPIAQVLNDMYGDRFRLLRNGDLQYKN